MKKIFKWLLYEYSGGYWLGAIVGMLGMLLAICFATKHGLIIFSFR